MKLKSKIGAVLAVFLCTVELMGVYFGGWSRGRMQWEGISSSCNLCIAFGSTYFWADAGDSLELTYDAQVDRGVFQLWIARLTPGHLGDVEARTDVPSSGSGTWHAPISRPGWYHLVSYGMSAGGRSGYDIGYNMSWRIDRSKPWYSMLAGAAR